MEENITIVPKVFLDGIDCLADKFARQMSSQKEGRYAKICYNNVYDSYRSISLFLYCYTQKLSRNKSSFVMNNIYCDIFKSITRMYYVKILKDLEDNQIFKINHKFCPTKMAKKYRKEERLFKIIFTSLGYEKED